MARTASFDGGAFFAALDAERQARQCTWRQVAEECGISASTLSRMAQGRLPDVNGLAALAAWSGLEVDRFVKSAASREEPKPMAVISSCLHADPQLSEEAAVAIDQMVRAAYRSMASQRQD